MTHKKTFEAIDKLKDVEVELHRLKNALEMANRALEAKGEPVGWAEHGVINWLADKQFNHTSFLYATPSQHTRNDTLEEVALEFEKMPFGDTGASICAFIRGMKR